MPKLEPRRAGHRRLRARAVAASVALVLTAGCSTLGSSGPSAQAVRSAGKTNVDQAAIKVVEMTDVVARRVIASGRSDLFSEALGEVPPIGSVVGRGDVLGVTIWEAPPAALFGGQAA